MRRMKKVGARQSSSGTNFLIVIVYKLEDQQKVVKIIIVLIWVLHKGGKVSQCVS